MKEWPTAFKNATTIEHIDEYSNDLPERATYGDRDEPELTNPSKCQNAVALIHKRNKDLIDHKKY
jgi:hypothetical protein